MIKLKNIIYILNCINYILLVNLKTITIKTIIRLKLFILYFILVVFECRSVLSRNRCPVLRVNNGRTRMRQGGRAIRITCNSPFKLVRGNEITNCIQGEWDSELPICARKF